MGKQRMARKKETITSLSAAQKAGRASREERKIVKKEKLLKRLSATAKIMKKQPKVSKAATSKEVLMKEAEDENIFSFGLSEGGSLTDALDEMLVKHERAVSKRKLKALPQKASTLANRKKIAAAELKQFASVIKHSSFQDQPVAMIQEHLRAGIAQQQRQEQMKAEEEYRIARSKTKESNKHRKERKKRDTAEAGKMLVE